MWTQQGEESGIKRALLGLVGGTAKRGGVQLFMTTKTRMADLRLWLEGDCNAVVREVNNVRGLRIEEYWRPDLVTPVSTMRAATIRRPSR